MENRTKYDIYEYDLFKKIRIYLKRRKGKILNKINFLVDMVKCIAYNQEKQYV